MNLETFVRNGQHAQAAVDRMPFKKFIETGPAGPVPKERCKTKAEFRQSINPAPLLCQSSVRKLLLDQAARTRSHKFTRVSGQTMIELNEMVRQWCVLRVARLPSMGRTI
jgi:hypothetical protein